MVILALVFAHYKKYLRKK